MENDERFKHLASDPRFKRLRRRQRKVEIDERFQHMFTDERFTLKYSKDKRGQTNRKTTGDDLKKYYSLKEDSSGDEEKEAAVLEEKHVVSGQQQQDSEEDEEEDDEGQEEDNASDATTVIDDEEEEEEEDDGDASVTNESELSSSSDETASDEEEEGDAELEGDVDNIRYDWKPLDHDAEVAESTTRRLAIQNLDWDRVDSKDLYTLVNSIRPPQRVAIYVSEFGKERLRRERLEGPQEIVEMPKEDPEEEEYRMLKSKMEELKNPKPKALRVNEYEDADEELDSKNEKIRERIRRYQLSRMKYYYAVVEFDSVESAELVYKELDGMEFEGSSLELDLRFIPDDVEFEEEDMKEDCNKLPDLTTYKAPQFISSALQQTTVKFTWDETDIRRQEKLHKAYTKEELDKDDLDAYLASESDSDEQYEDADENFDDSVSVVTANSEARLNKYKLLLKSLEEEESRKKKAELDVEWDNLDDDESGSEGSKAQVGQEESEEAGSELEALSGDGGSYADDQQSEFSDNSSSACVDERAGRQRDRRKEKRELAKEARRRRKKENRKEGEKRRDKAFAGDQSEDRNEELDLLVMDVEDKRRGEFQFNPEDDRFKAVYDSALYNIDPSHPNFKRTQAFDLMAEKKREKRRKTRA